MCFFSGLPDSIDLNARLTLFGSAAWAQDSGLGGGNSGLGSGNGFGVSGSGSSVQPSGGTSQPRASSSNDRAVDRAAGIGQPSNGSVPGKSGNEGSTRETVASGKDTDNVGGLTSDTTTLGKPSDQKAEDGDVTKANEATAEKDAAQSRAMMAAAAAPASVAPANAPEKPSIPEISGNGFFTQKIGIDVLPFHGIEPKLALNYNSARKTRIGGLYQGWLGYAWGLDGIDVIERASPGYGYPLDYDDPIGSTTDIFLLNGEELVPCKEGMVAASCSAGGTHVTENENFKRVVFSASANTWTVTDRDGTTSLFKSVHALSSSTEAAGTNAYKLQHDGRYLLAEVKDTYGNKVTYSYGDADTGNNRCPDAPVCYPRKITYGGGATISFYWEARPDFLVMANGFGLSYTKMRLRTILIKAGGAVRGAYKLGYKQAPFSDASRLTQVDRYGSDVVLDSAGLISEGTSRTIRKMVYDNAMFDHVAKSANIATKGGSIQVSDLNNDGRDELYASYSIANGGGDWVEFPYSSGVEIIDFNTDGTVRGRRDAVLPNVYNEGDVHFTPPGRFSKGNNGKAIGAYRVHTEGSESGTTYVTGYVYQTDNDAGFIPCNAQYVALCGGMPATPDRILSTVVALDADANGFDSAVNFAAPIFGVIDMAANGKQSVVNYPASENVNCGEILSGLPLQCGFGDVNGDGSTDVINARGELWLSTGKTFVRVSTNMPRSSKPTILRDADNDGKMDLHVDETIYAFSFDASGVALAENSSYFKASSISGDFNGDGLPDFVSTSRANEVMISQSPSGGHPNLLREVTLETGGVVSVDYAPSTGWKNKYMPQVLHAVKRLSIDDGRGSIAKTSYVYEGGEYKPAERKFVGYEKIAVTKPMASGETSSPVTTITYSQDLASYGLPTKTVSRDGANTASKTVTEGYTSTTKKPYRTFNTSTETVLDDASATVTLRKERVFDGYGNVTQIRDFGRKELTGDETWTVTAYSPNKTNYLVSYPRSRAIRSLKPNEKGEVDFTTAFGVYQRYELFYYDENESYIDEPTQGALKKRRPHQSVDPTSTYYEIFTYDSAGNKLSHEDGVGNLTEWDYDSKYGLYVVKERAPKYFVDDTPPTFDTRFVTTYTNNNICGKPATKVDWNGVTETYTYDAFCRPSGYTNSGTGKFVNTRYESEGKPTSQSILVEESPALGSIELFTRTYYDGLGRPWRVRTYGETESGARRFTDTAYDARGNVESTSFPFFEGSEPVWTTNSYDWQDRLVKTVNADDSVRSYVHSVPTEKTVSCSANRPVAKTEFKDEQGDLHRTYADKDGNTIMASTKLADAWISESRTYDVVGQLVGVCDQGKAEWAYTYDLMGNRLTAHDPDLGDWTYTYDKANRLTTQTDARGVISRLSYDKLGRLIKKTVQEAGEAAVTTVTNTYDTNEAGVGAAPFHNVGLLTKSVNGAATHSYSRSLTGSGTKLTTKSVIDGITHTTTEMKGSHDLTLWISYTPANLSVGTSSKPWTYDVSGRLLIIPGYITNAAYEADGQTASITYANGVSTTFTYDVDRRWLDRVTTAKGATTLLDTQYTTRDKTGRITKITATGSDDWTYAYDDLGRLITAKNGTGDNALSETYTYSTTGNLLSRTRVGSYIYPSGTADRPHAPTKIGTRAITYDANGNMSKDGVRTLTWSGSNQLEAVKQGTSTVTFTYGPEGARASKTWPAGKTLYMNANVEVDRTTSGSEVFTRYPHPDLKLVTTMANVTTDFFLHRDQLASVKLVTNEAGAKAESNTYAAYGEPTNKTLDTAKGYIGERFDAETGLMYLNARYYDPAFGRFVPTDDGAGYDVDGGGGDQVVPTAKSIRPASVLWQQARPMMPTQTNGATLQ